MVTAFKDKEGTESYQWIDIVNPTKTELNEVAARFGLHASLVEDCLQPEHLPKHEVVGENLFVILRAFNENVEPDADTIQDVTDKIAVFLGKDFFLTVHRPSFEFLVDIRKEYVDTKQCETPYHVLFRIFAHVMKSFDAPLADLIHRMDALEPKIFRTKRSNTNLNQRLYYMKRRATVIDNVFELSRPIHEGLKGRISGHHYNHLHDEFVRLQTSTRQVADSITSLLNIYISLSAQRTGEVMRVLTVFSMFFMPLTFIVGIYGMNFDVMPELRWPFGYLFAWGLMLSVTVITYLWFRRRGWM
jgi:magnesium transporter